MPINTINTRIISGNVITNPGGNPAPARKFEFQPRKHNPGTRNQLFWNPGPGQHNYLPGVNGGQYGIYECMLAWRYTP
jgi:hypothetical protein